MSDSVAGWPVDLPVSAVRVARGCADLDRSRAFYHDLLGLELLFEFHDHDGYDGLVLGLPDRSVQLELIHRHGGRPPVPHPENALVLYLQDEGAALRRRLAPLVPLLVPENPYWSARGAFAIDDPDGWQMLIAPASDLEE